MKATDLLKAQHDEVKSLFKRIERCMEDGEKRQMFEELAAKLVAHDGIEREIFYPACKQAMGMTELLREAMVEHGVIEFSLYLADQAQGKDDFGDKVKVLSEMVLHHVKEEEDDLFPAVRKAIDDTLLEELGINMKAAFDVSKKANFRIPLHKNLRLVMSGAIELPSGKSAKGASAKPAAERNAGAKNGNPKKSATHGRVHP